MKNKIGMLTSKGKVVMVITTENEEVLGLLDGQGNMTFSINDPKKPAKIAGPMSQTDVNSFLRMKLGTDLAWAWKGLDLLMTGQLDKEIRQNISLEENGIGLNKVDSPFLTRLWKLHREGRVVTVEEEDILVRRIQKYAGQLAPLWDEELVQEACKYYGIKAPKPRPEQGILPLST